ncbi:MAG: response regulator [Gammaproteobacteria bacterium]|nr:response regulator [Gammaproteobacteria bacterium]MDH5799733.1 response regulator [Gammaproteobacteria bacterium]
MEKNVMEWSDARILIVDDIPTNRTLLIRALTPLGYKIEEADSGESALKCLEQSSYDLILLDHLMPGLSGFETLKVIRSRYSRLQLPVIIVTALYETENIIQGLNFGANDYITKPFEFEVIQARVEAHLQSKKLQSDLIQAKETAEDISRTKSRFLSQMSHELRTPLNAILGFTELCFNKAKQNGHDQYVSNLQMIQDSGKNLLEIINNLLDLSKIEAGKLEINIEALSLKELMNHINQLCLPLLKQNKNRIHFRTDTTSDLINSDKTKLQQILTNLVANAAKFTQNGDITVETCLNSENTQSNLVLRVRDTGTGIRADQQEFIFKEFYQCHTHKTGGTGLGLAITRQLCELLGGRIQLESSSDKGSVFLVVIPVTLSQPQPQPQPESTV